MRDIPLSKSIAELEGIEWPEPSLKQPSALARCHRLRQVPLSKLGLSDLRALIALDVGLEFVMPLALKAVEREPLVEAEHYRGDLLVAMLRVTPAFYRARPQIRTRVEKVLGLIPAALEELDQVNFDTSMEALDESITQFRSAS